jgi:N-acetylneuraminic acid mutarotase
MPETPFFVRTYVITSQGDTGYNKTVFVDTTLSPVNEWFRKKDFLIGGSTAREGSVCFTLYNKEKGYDCAYVYGGNVGISYYKDLYEYDAKTDTWEQLNSVESPSIRSEAVAFSIEYYNSSGQKQISGFVGTGKDLANNKLDDWYEYYPDHNHWKPRENYPRGVSNAVGFGIGEKGYVGTGSSEGDILVSEFYSYNPIADTIGGSPWVQVTQFANNQSLKRKNGIAFVIDGFAFVGTGEGVGGVLYKDLWLFAPGDDMQNFGAWIQRESLPDSITGRTDAVGFSIEAQGYVGMGFDGVNSLQDLWRYDPFNDRWAQCADYKTGPNYIEGDPKYIRNAIGFGIEDRGFVGLGFRSSTYPGDKCSYELWVYRPW